MSAFSCSLCVFSYPAIIGLALAIVMLIALVFGVPIMIVGIFSWKKRVSYILLLQNLGLKYHLVVLYSHKRVRSKHLKTFILGSTLCPCKK